MRLVRGPVAPAGDPALDLAATHALLRQAGRGELGTTLRIYRPRLPMVAFGRRDTHRPGFAAAVQACRDAGFAPAVRAVGGRAVAHTGSALVLDLVAADATGTANLQQRFRSYGDLLAGVLRDFGVDARVGEVPGEYCPGAHSVNARGEVKLVGTAQRVIRGAWLFSAVVILDDADRLRPLLRDVYRLLDLPFDERSVGSVRTEAPDLDPNALETALLAATAPHTPTTWDPTTAALARSLLPDHTP